MREISNGAVGASSFTRDQWEAIASAKGEVRLSRDATTGQAVLYTSKQSLGGRFMGALRDVVFRQERNEARNAARNELRAFFGGPAEKLLQDTGIGRGDRIDTRKLGAMLNEMRVREPSYKLDTRLADPSATVHNTKIRDLRQNDANSRNGQLRTRAEALLTELGTHTASAFSAKATARWDATFASAHPAPTNTSAKLAIEMKALGASLATGKLNNGRAQGAVVQQLFRAHMSELKGRFSPGEIKLAQALASNTVLMDVAAGRISTSDATMAIRIMAEKTGVGPSDLLELMTDQFEAEVGAFDRAELQKFQHVKDGNPADKGGFSFKEIFLSGDLVVELYDRIVEPGSDPANGRMVFAGPMQERFGDLADAVEKWGGDTGLQSVTAPIDRAIALLDLKETSPKPKAASAAPPLPMAMPGRPQLLNAIRNFDASTLAKVTGAVPLPGEAASRGVTERQYALLRDVQSESLGRTLPDGTVVPPLAEAPLPGGATPKGEVIAMMGTRYGLDAATGEKVLARVETWFRNAPITLTIDATSTFTDGPQPKWGHDYKASQEVGTRNLSPMEVQELVGGFDHVDGLALPSSVDPSSRGVNYLRWRTEKDAIETDHRGLKRTEQAKFAAININFEKTHGFEGDSSSYGETHLLLKSEVRDRAAFNFNKTRELRADATMILHDIMRNENAEGSKLSFMDAMVHNALGLPGMVKTELLQVEIEIFGDLDYRQDVAEVRLPSSDNKKSLDKGVEKNARAYFEKANGVPVAEWSQKAMNAIVIVAPGSNELKQAILAAAAKL